MALYLVKDLLYRWVWLYDKSDDDVSGIRQRRLTIIRVGWVVQFPALSKPPNNEQNIEESRENVTS